MVRFFRRTRARVATTGLLSALAASVLAVPTAGAATAELATGADLRASATHRPLIVGHRGASGYRPEHTLASYELAIRLGADFIEPDLVSTKDRVLVARHENEISATTDVADQARFAGRRTTKVIDGVRLTGWFTEDFTLAELRTLRAKERIPELRPENTLYDDRYKVPTLEEILFLVQSAPRRFGRTVGIYPETKHPTYFDSIGLSLEEPLVRALRRHGLDRADAPVFVQSFETANLRELDGVLKVRLVQLIGGSGAPYDFVAAGDPRTYDNLVTRRGLAQIAGYADGIGPDKNRVVPRTAAGWLLKPTTLVRDAHRVDLLVHPYTFRNENAFLPLNYRKGDDPAAYGDAFAEYRLYFRLGVDGLFTDNPDTAREARAAFLRGEESRTAA